MKSIVALLIVSFCLLLFSKPANSQHSFELPIPPTPEAASLAKFSQVPVSHSTGLPHISIPLYEIQLRGFSLPISLNYHAGGIRVDEIASSAGLGWALSAGGTISSSVLGKPDFGYRGYVTGATEFPVDRELQPYEEFENGEQDYNLCKELLGMATLSQNPNLAHDTQPDLFFYSMGGRSGKFFFSRDGNAHTVPFEPLKIEGGDQIFRITDENGNIFTFAAKEVAQTTFIAFGGVPGTSTAGDYTPTTVTFLLSSVVTPQGDSLKLEYEGYGYEYRNIGSRTRHLRNPSSTCPEIPESGTESLTNVFGGQRIKRITSSIGHVVEFSYDSCGRADLAGLASLAKPGALTEVSIRVMGAKGVKKFRLGYEYFYSDPGIALITNNCNKGEVDPDDLRLKLVSVVEEGKPAYRVTYNESVRLPNRLSPAQDHWGFYNGSQHLLPKNEQAGFMDGGTKEPDKELMGAFLIKDLTNPTGGRTEFTFEPHDYFEVAGIERRDTLLGVSFENGSRRGPGQDSAFYKEISFEVGLLGSVVHDSVNVRFQEINSLTGINYYFRATITGVDNGFSQPLLGDENGIGEKQFMLAPGAYKLIIEAMGLDEEGAGHVMIFWKELTYINKPAVNRIAGGLRIRKIKYLSPESTPLERMFHYRELSDTTRSSGKTLLAPSYLYQYFVSDSSPIGSDGYKQDCMYLAQTSKSIHPLSTMAGSSVAYTSARVESRNEDEISLSSYKYSFASDHNPHGGAPPFTPGTSMEWMRGLLLEETDYIHKKDLNAFWPVKKIKHRYQRYYTPPSALGGESGNYTLPEGVNESHALGLQIMVVRPEREDVREHGLTVRGAVFTIESFKHVSVWQYKSETEEIFYDAADSTQQISVLTRYYYDRPGHSQLTRIKRNDSRGRQISTSLSYPSDFEIAVPSSEAVEGLKAMIDKHILNKFVEEQQWLVQGEDSLLLSSNLAFYKLKSQGVVQEQIKTLVTDKPLSIAEFTSVKVDGDGNLAYDQKYDQEWFIRSYSENLNPLEIIRREMPTALL
ncbi:hypothetical protein [uncultured Pontibacter sp.]|nr:hypothetical protein [uncultured Pontibacter sp.]